MVSLGVVKSPIVPLLPNDVLAHANLIIGHARDGLRMSAGAVGEDGQLSGAHLSTLEGTLDDLRESLGRIANSGLDTETHREVSDLLMAELEPYLDRSPTARALMARGEAPIIQQSTHAALTGVPPAAGMGSAIEGWVRSLPSMGAWTDIPAACIRAAAGMQRAMRSGPTLVLGVDHPGVAAHIHLLEAQGQVIPVAWQPGTTLPTLPETPFLVVVVGILESTPNRLAVALLRELRQSMPFAGRVVASALAPSPDAALVDLALGWPTIRRTPAQILDLFLLAGLSIVGDAPSPAPGLVLIAEDKSRAISQSIDT